MRRLAINGYFTFCLGFLGSSPCESRVDPSDNSASLVNEFVGGDRENDVSLHAHEVFLLAQVSQPL